MGQGFQRPLEPRDKLHFCVQTVSQRVRIRCMVYHPARATPVQWYCTFASRNHGRHALLSAAVFLRLSAHGKLRQAKDTNQSQTCRDRWPRNLSRNEHEQGCPTLLKDRRDSTGKTAAVSSASCLCILSASWFNSGLMSHVPHPPKK